MKAVRSGCVHSACSLSASRPFLLLVCLFVGAIASNHALATEPSNDNRTAKWVSAISNDRSDLLEQILNQHIAAQGNPLELLRQFAPNGKSALMVASKQGQPELVRRFVQLGAGINELTLTGGSPLMFAVLGNHVDLARWLHESGADINAKGSNGWSAATIAGAKGQAEMLRWLIEAGADINAPDVYRFTPLMRAVDNQHEASVQILLTLGHASVDFADESENTALHFAVANQQRAVVELLLSHGADPSHANRDGITPADLAKEIPALSTIFIQ